jgi:hypothetical protein
MLALALSVAICRQFASKGEPRGAGRGDHALDQIVPRHGDAAFDLAFELPVYRGPLDAETGDDEAVADFLDHHAREEYRRNGNRLHQRRNAVPLCHDRLLATRRARPFAGDKSHTGGMFHQFFFAGASIQGYRLVNAAASVALVLFAVPLIAFMVLGALARAYLGREGL